MRPMKGANLDRVSPVRFGQWGFEPKYDGWRVLVHVPTGKMLNRKLQPLSISDEFYEALTELQKNKELCWVDAEGLSRRHPIAKGTLIVLDIIETNISYIERRKKMESIFTTLPIDVEAEPNSLYLTPTFENDYLLWEDIRNNPFYEGIVAKQKNSNYIFGNSDTSETKNWVKHKFEI